MGVVWVAHNLILDVHVALKLLPSDKRPNQGTLSKRLLQEARTAAALGHPAICRAFDFGETHLGDPFVVSEMMHGETLADLLRVESRLAATRAVQILLPIIDGLAVAHAKGIVHRDVKPDNIFLSHDVAGRMQPKLLDFGIARFVESDSKLTVDGSLLGTPDYMSPEQAQGRGGADFRTDVWSTCVVLYEAVTGDVPFRGENYNAILYAVINEPARSILDFGAGAAGYAIGALINAGAMFLSGQEFQLLSGTALVAHSFVVPIEGLVTASVVTFLRKVRPELLEAPLLLPSRREAADA